MSQDAGTALAPFDSKSDARTLDGPDPGAIATTVTTAFGDITAGLGEVRELLMQLVGETSAFAELARADRRSEDLLPAIRAQLVDVEAAMVDYIMRSGTADGRDPARDAAANLYVIARASRTLSSVATLTRTTAASFGINALDLYLDDLKNIAVTIGDATKDVSRRCREMVKSLEMTRAGCQTAQLGLANISPELDRSILTSQDLSREEIRAAADVTARAEALATESKGKVKSFVSAIQFSDRIAQRIAHLESMLVGADSHVRKLAAAHAKSMSDDIAKVHGDITASMNSLAEIARTCVRFLGEGEISAAVRRGLNTRAEIGTAMNVEFERINAALVEVRRDTEQAATSTRDTQRAFDTLEGASKMVATAAINSTLHASRSGNARGALAILSQEVRETAALCLAAVGGSQAALNAITGRSANAVERVLTSGEGLNDLLVRFREDSEAGHRRLAELDRVREKTGDDAAALTSLIMDLRTNTSALAGVAAALAELAEALSQGKADGSPDHCRLAAIWDTYTMDEERRVHADVLADIPGTLPSEAASEDPATPDALTDQLLL